MYLEELFLLLFFYTVPICWIKFDGAVHCSDELAVPMLFHSITWNESAEF